MNRRREGSRRRLVGIVVAVSAFVLLLAFQNCGTQLRFGAHDGGTQSSFQPVPTPPPSGVGGNGTGYDGKFSYGSCVGSALAEKRLFLKLSESKAYLVRENCADLPEPYPSIEVTSENYRSSSPDVFLWANMIFQNEAALGGPRKYDFVCRGRDNTGAFAELHSWQVGGNGYDHYARLTRTQGQDVRDTSSEMVVDGLTYTAVKTSNSGTPVIQASVNETMTAADASFLISGDNYRALGMSCIKGP